MVVQFPRDGRGGTDAHADPHHLARVTYLPGAHPSDAAAQALHAVQAAGADDPDTAAADGPDAVAGRPAVSTGRRPARARSAAEGERGRAANVSVHQLARRGMSRWELEQVLRKRGVDDETAAAELDRLVSVGLLDDAALAVSVVYSEHARKGRGRQAIAHELRRRHVAQEIIDDALSEIDDDDELNRAREVALGRVGQLSDVDDQAARRRLAGFLGRKGYTAELVQKVVEEALATRR